MSDIELVVFALALMLDPEDLREQFPLALEIHPVERMAYEPTAVPTWTPGTLEIAHELGAYSGERDRRFRSNVTDDSGPT